MSAAAPAVVQPPPPPTRAHAWPLLHPPPERERPARGLDVLGDWITGVAARRAGRLDHPRAARILAAARAFENHSDAALADSIAEIRAAVAVARDDPASIDRAYAVAVEAIRRETGLRLHPEQVLGALALAAGACVELSTGEGKTLTAVLPAALDGWCGRGVHVVTVNDYLARRDAETTAPAFRRLGLSVGVVHDATAPDDRRAAYRCDVTYAADKQVIFDHLRDRLLMPLRPRLAALVLDEIAPPDADPGSGSWSERVVMRGLHAAIIDEADSVLIDDAVTPAIISGPAGESGGAPHYADAAAIAGRLAPVADYVVDARARLVRLTPAGRDCLAAWSRTLPPFWSGPRRREELIVQALTAKELYRPGEDYIVKDGEVLIVDRSTGRALPGRKWQLGIHQAVEAKEGLAVSADNATLARSSYQGFFRRYRRLAGMTGTAAEVANELWASYRLPVVRVPTHRPVARTRAPDRVFAAADRKLEAAADRVAQAHALGRPVLVGTWSIASSEALADLLRARAVPCEILNATREAEEAAIIARAGLPGAVTVATNMAGRGTDIRLTEAARAAGGLLVLSTERHDEARVDRQLAGRAGRQGDPGGVECFVSLQDQLILRHGPAPLVRLVRAGGPLGRLAAPLLWWLAQRAAGGRWATLRAESAKADAWFDMALHDLSR